jgi:hypothetical protein
VRNQGLSIREGCPALKQDLKLLNIKDNLKRYQKQIKILKNTSVQKSKKEMLLKLLLILIKLPLMLLKLLLTAEDSYANKINEKIKITRLHIFTCITCYVYSSLQKH